MSAEMLVRRNVATILQISQTNARPAGLIAVQHVGARCRPWTTAAKPVTHAGCPADPSHISVPPAPPRPLHTQAVRRILATFLCRCDSDGGSVLLLLAFLPFFLGEVPVTLPWHKCMGCPAERSHLSIPLPTSWLVGAVRRSLATIQSPLPLSFFLDYADGFFTSHRAFIV